MSEPPDKHDPASGAPGDMSPQERARFEERISELGDRLGKVRSQRESGERADADAEMRGRGMAYGMRMAAELVAAVIVGGVIGWSLDWVLGSRPWLFLLFFLLGFAAGVLNVMRSYERMQREFAARGGDIGHSVPDDD
ncbi:MAG: AtpZ/AtpI family protein [Hyphomicrobiaceae bacterium]